MGLNLERQVISLMKEPTKDRKKWIAKQLKQTPADNFPTEEDDDNLNMPDWLDQLTVEELDQLSNEDANLGKLEEIYSSR